MIPMGDGIQASRHHIDQNCSRSPRSQIGKTAAVDEVQKHVREDDKVKCRKKEKVRYECSCNPCFDLQRRLTSVQSSAQVPQDDLHGSAVPTISLADQPRQRGGGLCMRNSMGLVL